MTSSVELSWLLDDLVTRVPQIEQAVILSRDGLAVAASASLSREDGERLAAIAAGFDSLARGTARQLGSGQARQVIVELDSAFLFVTAAGAGSSLAVVSSADAEVGLIAYEMALLVKRVADHLAVRPQAVPGAGKAM
jgi:predicted regulator of Ras-like GTPase activity (Roadblock/LC7/MglB family)